MATREGRKRLHYAATAAAPTLVGSGFAADQYNETYHQSGTHNGQPVWVSSPSGSLLYYDAVAGNYRANPTFATDGDDTDYNNDTLGTNPRGAYDTDLADPPAGTVS